MKESRESVKKSRSNHPADEGPWLWIPKQSLRIIRDLDSQTSILSAISVYTALCQIASDSECSVFTTTRAYISQLSGASVATVQRRLKDLKDIGLIESTTPELKKPSTYALLSMAHGDTTIAHSETTMNHTEPTIAHGPYVAHCNSSEESGKNPEEHGRLQTTLFGIGEEPERETSPKPKAPIKSIPIPESLNSPKFIEAWENWISDRRERKKPVGHRAAELQLKKLEDMGVERAIVCINFSIESGYQGLFEPTKQNDKKNVRSSGFVNRNIGTLNENVPSGTYRKLVKVAGP